MQKKEKKKLVHTSPVHFGMFVCGKNSKNRVENRPRHKKKSPSHTFCRNQLSATLHWVYGPVGQKCDWQQHSLSATAAALVPGFVCRPWENERNLSGLRNCNVTSMKLQFGCCARKGPRKDRVWAHLIL